MYQCVVRIDCVTVGCITVIDFHWQRRERNASLRRNAHFNRRLCDDTETR